ncbi:MAG: Hsp20/alpha crystallin family protein [Aureliella sp.]
MDDLFDRLFTGENNHHDHVSAPTAIWEEADHFHIEMELPGISEDNVEVTFEKGQLTIAANREAADSTDRKYLVNERSFGKVMRTISVSDEVDPDSIEASFTSGLLHVTLAKRPSELPKKIQVKAQ